MRFVLVAVILTSAACSSSSSETTPGADTGSTDALEETAVGDAIPEAGGCTSARDTAIKPIDTVSTGVVKALAADTYYVDASAGGFADAASNPWVYLNLATGKRVDITDKQAFTSTDWDLGLKRALIRTNDGDSGPGSGGAVFLAGKTFDMVGAADAASAMLKSESWFDAECTPKTDPTGAVRTTFDGWYDYDMASMVLTPKDGVWIVRGAKGELYKLSIDDFYSFADGSTGGQSAHYKLRWAAIK